MKKKVGVIVGVWLAGAVLAGNMGRLFPGRQDGKAALVQAAYSGDIQEDIDEASQEIKEAQEEKKQLEKDIKAIEEKKSDVLEYVELLDGKLTELSGRMQRNKADIVTVKKKVQVLRQEKEQAEADREKQYDIMAERIKYMYENGSSGYLELLFGAESLSELFNRAEYVSRVAEYDNNIVLSYQKVCDKLEKAKKKLDDNLLELRGLRENLKVEEESVQLMMDKKTAELNRYKVLIQEKNKEARKQEDILKKHEEELERLLEEQRRRAEQEARERAERENRDSSPNRQTKQGYRWPLPISGVITSYFGYRKAPTAGASTYHKGIDISVPVGTSVLAARAGIVVTASYSASAGNYVALYHGGGIYSYYMHCSSLTAGVGEEVLAGQQVALSGNTGISTGPHLHFAIYANGAYVNPLGYVSQP
ncbi:peptidase M23 [bacterium D16-51]|nr:peptidase M23 [bacterium D16-59]RKI61287.1 peptidase M23 [bacterium D16-51]